MEQVKDDVKNNDSENLEERLRKIKEDKSKSEAKPKAKSLGKEQISTESLQEQVELNELLRARYDILKDFFIKNNLNSVPKNPGYETGLNFAKITGSMELDKSNVFSSPSVLDLKGYAWKQESARLVTAEELAEICAKFENLGYPKEQMGRLFWDLSRYCADTSASSSSMPKGTFDFEGGSVLKESVIAVIREKTTLRRVCRSFAPIVWNHMLSTNQPPADWQAKGFPETAKFAAFDFFDCVMNKAAIQPLEGLIRLPTEEERVANETFKTLALDKHSKNRRFANYKTEVTGGKYGKEFQRKYRSDDEI